MMSVEIVVLKKDRITDFARERNLLLALAKSDWVLFIDTDEKLSRELKKEIQNLDEGGFDGFYLRRKNFFCRQFVGEDRILRLAKKNAGKWSRRVHEVWEIKGKTGELKNPLYHNTANNLSDYIKKVNYYSTLHAEANREEGKTPSLFKLIFYPVLKFVQALVRSHNIVFSLMQSFHSFLAWSKLWVLQKETK